MSIARKLAFAWIGLCAAVVVGVMVYVSGWLVVAGLFAFGALTTMAFGLAVYGK